MWRFRGRNWCDDEECHDHQASSTRRVSVLPARRFRDHCGRGDGGFDVEIIAKVGYQLIRNAAAVLDLTTTEANNSMLLSRRAALGVAAAVVALVAVTYATWRRNLSRGDAAEPAELYRKGVGALRDGFGERITQSVAYVQHATKVAPRSRAGLWQPGGRARNAARQRDGRFALQAHRRAVADGSC